MARTLKALAATLGLALFAGCGGGGSTPITPPTGTLVAATRGVPETVGLTPAPGLRVAGGDDYLVIFSESAGAGAQATVRVNGGGGALSPLPARSADTTKSQGARRHIPMAHWPLPAGARAPRTPLRQGLPTVGSQRTFNVVEGSQPTVTATLQAIGTHCLLYVDNNTPNNAFGAGDLADLQSEFDNQIYPTDTSVLGQTGDVDGNDRIIILLTPTIRPGGYGYFYPADVMGLGNQADMLYALVPNPSGGTPYATLRTGLLATMAHELAHLITFHYKRNLGGEESWLNEAISFNLEQLNGWLDSAGGSPENVYYYFRSPESYTLRELTGSYDDGHAGVGYLFVRYLVGRFGQSILGTLVQSNQIGPDNVATATGTAYEALMADVASASFLAGTGVSSNPLYAIAGFDTHGTYPVEGVTLTGPGVTRVSAANGHPAFNASWAKGGWRYVRLTNVPSVGAAVALATDSGANVRATFVRIPAATP